MSGASATRYAELLGVAYGNRFGQPHRTRGVLCRGARASSKLDYSSEGGRTTPGWVAFFRKWLVFRSFRDA